MGEEMKRPLDEETSGVVCTQVWKNDLWGHLYPGTRREQWNSH